MGVAVLILGSLCVVAAYASEANQVACYNAKTCVHNAREKCGIDKTGEHRRFFDYCDMMEYNCLRFKDFMKTSMANCAKLPKLDPKRRKYD